MRKEVGGDARGRERGQIGKGKEEGREIERGRREE